MSVSDFLYGEARARDRNAHRESMVKAHRDFWSNMFLLAIFAAGSLLVAAAKFIAVPMVPPT
jgi:hypothetical protein